MKELVFATNNKHKLSEIRQILGNFCVIRSLSDIGFSGDIEETAPDLEGNALLKARYIHDRYGCNCFADDTGLEVDALNGAPGVYSARYAGEKATYADNVNKMLGALKGQTNRSARFRTVIALILDHQEFLFDGIVEGVITTDTRGTTGFGYDPIFMPLGHQRTFAEMSAEEKNALSHRGRATAKLQAFLEAKVGAK